MSLETLEGLPDEVANLYKKGEDGKFHLESGGDGLKSALHKEREGRQAAEKALKEREAAEAKARKDSEEAQALAKGEFEKVNAAREAELKAAKEELQQTRIAHENHMKETKALALLGPIAVSTVALEDMSRRFMDQLEVVQGKLLVKSDPSITPEKLAESFRSNPDFAHCVKGANANGGGAQNPGKANAAGDAPTTSHAMIAAGLKELNIGA